MSSNKQIQTLRTRPGDNELSYHHHVVRGDSNCLYRSVASALEPQLLKPEVELQRALLLRKATMSYLEEHLTEQVDDTGMDYMQYYESIAPESAWYDSVKNVGERAYGGAFELDIMSRLKRFSYKVYQLDEGGFLNLTLSKSVESAHTSINLLLKLNHGAEAANHYDYLRRVTKHKVKSARKSKSSNKSTSSVSSFSSLASSSSEDTDSSKPSDGSSSEADGSETDHMANFLDGLVDADLDQLDEFTKDLEDDDFKNAFADFDAELTTDMLDILGRGKDEVVDKQTPIRLDVPPSGTLKSERSMVDYNVVITPLVKPLFLVYKEGLAMIRSGHDYYEVGVAREDFDDFQLDDKDPILEAAKVNESSNTKGTGLGFSSFVHSSAILSLMTKGDTLEPHEGFDFIKSKVTFEMTGKNYATRVSRALVVLSKYKVLQYTAVVSDENIQIIRYSMMEDAADPTMFCDTGLDGEHSPYTEVNRRIMDSFIRMTDSNYLNLAGMFRSWHSRQPLSTIPKFNQELDGSLLMKSTMNTGKIRDGVPMYPAPLRVVPGRPESHGHFDSKDYIIYPQTQDILEVKTTYRNMVWDDNVEEMLLTPCEGVIPNPFASISKVSYWMHDKLCDYSVYSSMWVESELLPKVNGARGNFYSTHSNTGICWVRTTSSSITWYVAYYSFTKQPRSCGIWSMHDEGKGIWLGPTFKVSINDINHAKIMPHKALAMVAGVIPYTKDRERASVVKKVMHACAIFKSSSWQTSVLSKSFRFLVLNMISRSGDPQSQIDNVTKTMDKPLPSSDYILVRCIFQAINRHNDKENVTPMLGLPMRFINFEKDISLSTMWHMRKIREPVLTVTKLLKAAAKELTTREEELAYLDLMDFMLKAANKGDLTQLDYDIMLEYRPNFPHFNPLMFAGLAYIAAKGTDFGASQKSASVRLTTLISDRKCIVVKTKLCGVVSGLTFKQARAADAVASYLKSHDDPPSIFHLMTRMSNAPSEPLVNYTVEKGGKGARREVPQMDQRNRVQQMYEEKNLSIYVDQEQDDFMTDPAKFSKFSEDSIRILRAGGIISSEDKASFCHNFLPEHMAICVYVVARMVGSTGMVSAAGLLMCDTIRYTIMPEGVTKSEIPEGVDVYDVHGVVGKKILTFVATKNIKNFQQGQRAYAAAMINTVFTKAIDKVQKESNPLILDSSIRTTSDDLSRGVVVDANSVFDECMVEDDYFGMALDLNRSCMMENSVDKFMTSRLIGEFNNVVAGPNGLLNSSITMGMLSVQPLNGDNPLDDLISMVSNSKMSLPWGTSLDVIRTVYYSYFSQYQQKWLFTQETMDWFVTMGLLPSTDEELIEGFAIRTEEMRLRVASLFTADQVAEVLSGDVQVLSALRTFRVRDSKKKRVSRITFVSKVEGVLRTFRRITASRFVKGRMSASINRPLPIAKRLAVRDGFLEIISKPYKLQTPDAVLIADMLKMRFKVHIIPMYPQMRHTRPFKMGDSRRHSDVPNLNKVRVYKLTGVVLTEPLTEEEMALTELDDEEFARAEFRIESRESVDGASWLSPAGASLMRFQNDIMYKTPMAFTYKVDIPSELWSSKKVIVWGTEYDNYEPLFISGSAFQKATQSKCHLPFGTGWIGSDKYALVQSLNGSVTKLRITDLKSRRVILKHPNLRRGVLVDNVKSLTPVTIAQVGSVLAPWLNNSFVGDPTALLNYGNYINTKSDRVAKLRKSMLETLGCSEPKWSNNQLREWPYFIKNSYKVAAKRINAFRGYKSICRLEVTFSTVGDGAQTIDCTHEQPSVLPGYIENIDEDGQWEDDDAD